MSTAPFRLAPSRAAPFRRPRLAQALLFWTALYALCFAAALPVTPGAPEALGFAAPAVGFAAPPAWRSRGRSRAVRRACAALAAGLAMVSAVTGVCGRAQDPAAMVAAGLDGRA
jgi:hypothetical protein